MTNFDRVVQKLELLTDALESLNAEARELAKQQGIAHEGELITFEENKPMFLALLEADYQGNRPDLGCLFPAASRCVQ